MVWVILASFMGVRVTGIVPDIHAIDCGVAEGINPITRVVTGLESDHYSIPEFPANAEQVEGSRSQNQE